MSKIDRRYQIVISRTPIIHCTNIFIRLFGCESRSAVVWQIIDITTGLENQIRCAVMCPVHPHWRTDRQIAVPNTALCREVEISIALIDGVLIDAIHQTVEVIIVEWFLIKEHAAICTKYHFFHSCGIDLHRSSISSRSSVGRSQRVGDTFLASGREENGF